MGLWESIVGYLPTAWVIGQISVRKREVAVGRREDVILAKEEQFSELIYTRDRNLGQLKSGVQQCYHIRLEKVSLRFDGAEPYVEISFYAFNGSVFDLRFHDLELTGSWNDSPFRQVPRVADTSVVVGTGQLSAIRFEQPIPIETRDGLKHITATNSILRWEFAIKGRFEIIGTKEVVRFSSGPMTLIEKPIVH